MTETRTQREIEVGDMACDFTLQDENGNPVVLSSFRGKKNVVLAFYPFDWSPVCTEENCSLSQEWAQFLTQDAVVFGISCDSRFSHKAWKEKLGLKHSLLSDPGGKVCRAYGLFLEDLNCAKRATVVVDKTGRVVFKKVQELKVPRNPKEILAALA
jgi:peroxiredoxin